MRVLGYDRWGAGGRLGRGDNLAPGRGYGRHLYGIHINMVAVGAAEGRRPAEFDAGKGFSRRPRSFRRDETGYQWIQGTKPQTLAYALNDSPTGLCGMDRREVSQLERLSR